MHRALYDLGQDITLCWGTSNISGSEPIREDCRGAYMEFTHGLPDLLYSNIEYNVSFEMHVPIALNPLHAVAHANIHSCLRNNIFCTPFVANTPNLATHSPALTGFFDDAGNSSFYNHVALAPNQYTVICHGRWNDIYGTTHDMARARIVDVLVSILTSCHAHVRSKKGIGTIDSCFSLVCFRDRLSRIRP